MGEPDLICDNSSICLDGKHNLVNSCNKLLIDPLKSGMYTCSETYANILISKHYLEKYLTKLLFLLENTLKINNFKSCFQDLMSYVQNCLTMCAFQMQINQ